MSSTTSERTGIIFLRKKSTFPTSPVEKLWISLWKPYPPVFVTFRLRCT